MTIYGVTWARLISKKKKKKTRTRINLRTPKVKTPSMYVFIIKYIKANLKKSLIHLYIFFNVGIKNKYFCDVYIYFFFLCNTCCLHKMPQWKIILSQREFLNE